jgi:hypothetical protein
MFPIRSQEEFVYYWRLHRLSRRSLAESKRFPMPDGLSRRQELILAALAAESGAAFAPVQVQKLFFLVDENIANEIGGRAFAFAPYDYGPFDRAVYQELGTLCRMGFVNIEDVGPSAGRRRYSLTPHGQAAGEQALNSLSAIARDYIAKVSAWVRSMSFAQLVGAIYRSYPEMRVNSVFRD